jgi:hypothetical protein
MSKWLRERFEFLGWILTTKWNRHYFSMLYAMMAHAGQKYDGRPYFLEHLAEVYNGTYYHSSAICSVAWLHDLLEDTKWPLPFWLHKQERDAIILLTRTTGIPYFQYVRNIATSDNELVWWVKYYDALTNRDHSKRGSDRYRKYSRAINILNYPSSSRFNDPKRLHYINEDEPFELTPI